MMNRLSFTSCAALLAFGLMTTSCGGGDGDSAAPNGSFVLDGLVQDAPADDLLAFRAEVQAVRLHRLGGGMTDNLLSAPVGVEWLGLQGSSAWLFQQRPAQGTYTAVQLALTPGSLEAVSADGTPVAVNATATTFDTPLSAPLVVGTSGYARLVVDLDLRSSLSGNVAAPPIAFTPSASTQLESGSSAFPIDEIKGVVSTFDAAEGTLRMDAFADDDLFVPLGSVSVTVPPGALLVQENDGIFASSETFFAALQSGATLLEVHGSLRADSTVVATRIEVEDQTGGSQSASVVKIEGRVAALGLPGGFDLQIIEIEKGASIAGPVLAGLGSPSVIQVDLSAATLVDDDHSPVSSSALLIGQKVDVKFRDFATSPFQATWVEIDDVADNSATIEDVSGAPGSIVVRLRSGEPAILSGAVDSASTDVVVDLASANVFLDVDGDPLLGGSDLLPGLRVNVRGAFSGSSSAPSLAATRVRVRPGEFEGEVTAANSGSSAFDASVSSIDDPFGSNVTAPPFTVVLDPRCIFDGDVGSASGFFMAFANLSPGEMLEVEVEGIGSGNANEVRAFAIKAEVD